VVETRSATSAEIFLPADVRGVPDLTATRPPHSRQNGTLPRLCCRAGGGHAGPSESPRPRMEELTWIPYRLFDRPPDREGGGALPRAGPEPTLADPLTGPRGGHGHLRPHPAHTAITMTIQPRPLASAPCSSLGRAVIEVRLA
jgi:hypothetical protein